MNFSFSTVFSKQGTQSVSISESTTSTSNVESEPPCYGFDSRGQEPLHHSTVNNPLSSDDSMEDNLSIPNGTQLNAGFRRSSTPTIHLKDKPPMQQKSLDRDDNNVRLQQWLGTANNNQREAFITLTHHKNRFHCRVKEIF